MSYPKPKFRAIKDKYMSQAITRWRCKNCGQIHFTAADDNPPDVCAYCRDMTTWARVAEPLKQLSTLLFWCCDACGQIYFAAPDNDPPLRCKQCRSYNSFVLYRR